MNPSEVENVSKDIQLVVKSFAKEEQITINDAASVEELKLLVAVKFKVWASDIIFFYTKALEDSNQLQEVSIKDGTVLRLLIKGRNNRNIPRPDYDLDLFEDPSKFTDNNACVKSFHGSDIVPATSDGHDDSVEFVCSTSKNSVDKTNDESSSTSQTDETISSEESDEAKIDIVEALPIIKKPFPNAWRRRNIVSRRRRLPMIALEKPLFEEMFRRGKYSNKSRIQRITKKHYVQCLHYYFEFIMEELDTITDPNKCAVRDRLVLDWRRMDASINESCHVCFLQMYEHKLRALENWVSYGVHIKLQNGRKISVQVAPLETIFLLKKLIRKTWDFPEARQRLIFAGVELDNSTTVYENGIVEGNVVHLVLWRDLIIEVRINTYRGTPYSVHIQQYALVKTLKRMLEHRYKIPTHQQLLMFVGKMLDDDHGLYHYRITDGSELNLAIR